MTSETFGVWCEVWSGVTGSRSAWLKSNGVVQTFETHEEAERRASDLNIQMNGRPHRKADFRYSVRQRD
jgi:hypothetical protein